MYEQHKSKQILNVRCILISVWILGLFNQFPAALGLKNDVKY